jgi:uncharacterized protein (TIGR03435 family)
MRAYKVQDSQISGPGWLDSEGYDIDATFPADTPGLEWAAMLQTLLADRFKLAVHRETKDRTAYVLAVDKGGPKLHEASEATVLQMKMDGPMRHVRGKTSIAKLAAFLSDQMRQTVLDRTGLKGIFDIALDFTPDENAPVGGADLRTAVETQLGLRLEMKKEPLSILAIDHVEKIPVEN